MSPDNNQIFRNWLVMIHRDLTKISAEIIQCIIFERNGLSIALSTLWAVHRMGEICTQHGKLLVEGMTFFLHYNNFFSKSE